MEIISQPLLKNISVLYRIWQIYLENDLKKLNIKSWQWLFLMCLYKKEWLSQGEISRWLNIDKWTTAKAIKQLENGWYIRRESDATDKRIQRVYLTKRWKDIKREIMNSINIWGEKICKDLSNDEELLLIGILEKLVWNAVEYNKSNLKNNHAK